MNSTKNFLLYVPEFSSSSSDSDFPLQLLLVALLVVSDSSNLSVLGRVKDSLAFLRWSWVMVLISRIRRFRRRRATSLRFSRSRRSFWMAESFVSSFRNSQRMVSRTSKLVRVARLAARAGRTPAPENGILPSLPCLPGWLVVVGLVTLGKIVKKAKESSSASGLLRETFLKKLTRYPDLVGLLDLVWYPCNYVLWWNS